MNSSTAATSSDRPRVGAIVVASFIGFLAGQLLALLFEFIGASAADFPGGMNALAKVADPPWWANTLGLIGLWIGFASAIYYAHHDGGLRPLPHQWRLRPADLVYVVVGVAAQLVVDLLYAPFHFKSLDHPVHHLFNASHGATFVLLALLTTVVAPFFEEWLFRGVLFRAIAEGATNLAPRRAVLVGALVSAALFGLAHGEPLQFAGLFLLGILLAYIVQRTKRLAPSYVTHLSFNAAALVAVIAQRAGH